jgi:DNA polymerase III subunit gamma/tau
VLLGGPKGCGKTTIARIISRAVSCGEIVDGEPCNACELCISVIQGTSLSHREFDAATSGTIENIRSIIEGIEYQNFDGSETVIIIDEAHRLSLPAQDALLKAMEERLLFIVLCTTEPSKIRPALRDRVDEYAIRPPSAKDLEIYLTEICTKENISYEQNAIRLVVESSERSPRTCLNEINSICYQGTLTEEFVKKYYRYDVKQSVANALSLITENISFTMSELSSILERESPIHVRDLMVAIISNSIRASFEVPIRENIPLVNITRAQIPAWQNMGRSLTQIEKPSVYDLEIVIMSFVKQDESVSYIPITVRKEEKTTETHTPIKLPKSQETIPVSKVAPAKVLEIDGVKFSSEESLTSVDSKITGGRGPSAELNRPVVEWDRHKIPMSEQEFAHEFIQRIRLG